MRYLTDESTYIFGQFDSGDTVTITVYKASDASVIINAVSCSHLANGIFKYLFSDSVATKTEYLYVMTNSAEEHAGKIILGGYPDSIKDKTDNLPASPAPANEYDTEMAHLDVNVSTRNDITPPTVEEIKTELEGAGTKLALVKTQTDKMSFTGDDIKATLGDETVNLSIATEEQVDNIDTITAANLNATVGSRSSHGDPTNAIKGTPGKTIQEVYDNEKGTDGAYEGTPPSVEEIREEIEKVGTKLTEVKNKTDTIDWDNITMLVNTEGGKWEIAGNQMIFYEADNQTEVMRFNLFNGGGNPAMTNVMKRERA